MAFELNLVSRESSSILFLIPYQVDRILMYFRSVMFGNLIKINDAERDEMVKRSPGTFQPESRIKL